MSSSVHPRLLALAALMGALLLAAVAAPGAQAQATRTWVSGVGDDANPCSRTAPCKTFAGSISKTAAGGEINTLDPGGFGAVTITKAITIDGSAGGGILVSGTPGVVVNAAATDDVTLRNIDIQTVGPGTTCGQPNVAGVRVLGARSFTMIGGGVGPIGNGVQVTPASTATDVLLDGIAIRGAGCDVGVGIAPTGTGSVDATVRNATITGMASALRVGSGGRSWLSGSTLTGNTLGLDPQGTGTIASYYGTNQIHGNTTDGTPTSVIDAPIPGPAGATGAEGVPGTPGAVGPAGPAGPPGPAARSSTTTPPATKKCVVPKLTGGSLTSARTKLAKAGCKIGTVKRLKGSRRGTKVVSQTSKAGTSKPSGAKIGVTLGKA